MEKYFDISKFFMKNEQMKERIQSIPVAVYSHPVKVNEEQQKNIIKDGAPTKNTKYMDDLYSEVFLDVYFKT
jgi:hypothetical protein